MSTISKISAIFTANTAGLELGVKRAGLALKNMGRDVAGLRSSLNNLVAISGARLFGDLVGYANTAVRSLLAMAQTTAESVDKMSKLAQATGQSYAEFSGLAYAGELAGLGVNSMAKALLKADETFVRAQQGSRSARDAFAAIGLSVDELVGRTSAERFEAIAQAINSLPDPAQRTAAAIALLGEEGAQLLPLFAGGAEGIRQAREEFERFGGALSNTQAANVESMNDAWTRVQTAVKAVTTQVVANLAPAVKAVFDTLSDFIAKAGGANIGQNISEAFFNGAEVIAGAVDYLWEQLTAAWAYASEVIAQFGGVVNVYDKVTSISATVWSAGEAVFKAVAALLTRSMAGYAEILSLLPTTLVGEGWEAAAQSLSESADRLSREADAATSRAIDGAFGNAAEEAGRALAGALDRPAGRLESFVGRIRQQAKDAEDRSGDAAAAAVGIAGDLAAKKISDAFKGISAIDARSSAGVNEILRLTQQRPDPEQKKQTNLLAEIADNTADQIDLEEFGF